MAPHNSPILTDFSHELLCHILQYLPLKKVLSISMLCKKLQYAVDMHLRLCKEIDLCEGKIYDYMPSTITDDHMHALLKKCPHLEAVYGLHPLKVERRRLRKRSALTVPGIIEALCLCCSLKSVETSDLRLLDAIMNHLPQVDIIGHFQNRDSVFPPDASQRLKLQPYPRISSLHLIGVEVPELTAMPHLHHLHLQCVRFTKLQPFRAFLAQNLKTFVMKHCMGPSLSLRYLSLIIALSSSPSLSRLELVRVPLPGGLFQRAVEDSYRHSGFVHLKTLVISGCKGVLESDLGHLMIVSSKNLESISIQPSLTRDSLFVSLSFANCMFPKLKSLHLGYVDKLNAPGEWTNDTLLSIGLADIPDTPSSLTDSGMKVISRLFPNIKNMSVSNCPHLMAMDQWSALDGEQQVWKELSDLTLQRCHCLQLPSFALFLAFLPKIEVVILNDMFREPPKGCSHVGLSAGTGLGMSSAVVSNQDEHIAVQGHHQEFELHPDDHPDNEDEFIEVDNLENPDQHIMVLQQEFFDEENQIARVAQREDILPVGNVPENQIRRELNADYRAAEDASPVSTTDDETRRSGRKGSCRRVRRRKPKRSLERRTSSDDEASPKKVAPKKKPKPNDRDGICPSKAQPSARGSGRILKECRHEKKCQKNCSKGFDPNKPSTSKDGNCVDCRCADTERKVPEPKGNKRGRVSSSSESEPIGKKSNLDSKTKYLLCADRLEKDTDEKCPLTRDLSCSQEPESSVIENTEMLPHEERSADVLCGPLTEDNRELSNMAPEPTSLDQYYIDFLEEEMGNARAENRITPLATNSRENHRVPKEDLIKQGKSFSSFIIENTDSLPEDEKHIDKKIEKSSSKDSREMLNSYARESESLNQYKIKDFEKKDEGENHPVESSKGCSPTKKDPSEIPAQDSLDEFLSEETPKEERLDERKESFCSPEHPNEVLISSIQNPKSSYQFNAEHTMKNSAGNVLTRDQSEVFSVGSEESDSSNLFKSEKKLKICDQNESSEEPSVIKQNIMPVSDVDSDIKPQGSNMIVKKDVGIIFDFPGKIKSEPESIPSSPQNSMMVVENEFNQIQMNSDVVVVPNRTMKCDTSNDLNANCDLSFGMDFEPVLVVSSQTNPSENGFMQYIEINDTNINNDNPIELEGIPSQVEFAADDCSQSSVLPTDRDTFVASQDELMDCNDLSEPPANRECPSSSKVSFNELSYLQVETIPTPSGWPYGDGSELNDQLPPETQECNAEMWKELSKSDTDTESRQNNDHWDLRWDLRNDQETIVVQEDYKPNDHNYCSLNVDIKSEPESVPSPPPPVYPGIDEPTPHHSRESQLNGGFLGTVQIKSEPESLPPSPRGEVEDSEAGPSQQDSLALSAEVKSECESAEDVPQENNAEPELRRQNHTRIIDCHCCFEIKSECESGGESCPENGNSTARNKSPLVKAEKARKSPSLPSRRFTLKKLLFPKLIMSSYRDKYSGGGSSGRRDSYGQSRRDDYRRRSHSPASSSGRSSESSIPPRSDKALPEQFGKVASIKKEDDDSTVLQCMRRSFDTNPLGCLTKCLKSDTLRLKVWTRNFKEIRGICTGTVIAFDKHWNMILSDVKEVYLKPKKAKTPFLSSEKEAKDLPELPPKQPKKKKDPAATAVVKSEPVSADPTPASDPATETAVEGKEPEKKKTEKRKKKKRRTNIPTDRSMDLCFIRGDNIVMAAVVEVQSEGEEEND